MMGVLSSFNAKSLEEEGWKSRIETGQHARGRKGTKTRAEALYPLAQI